MFTKWWIVLSVCLTAASLCAAERPVLPRGHVLFATDFEGRDALEGWSGQAKLEEGFQGGHALAVERPAGSPSSSSVVTRPLAVEPMRGYLIHFSARIKAQDVGRKPNPWNGVKFMAPIVTGSGRSWPAAEMGVGTFDWQRVAFAARVPEDAKSISLCLGLELVSGKAWFDDIRITVAKPPIAVKARAAKGPVYKGHDLPRLRGAMISPDIDEEGLRVLGQEWNANLIRWQLIRRGKIADPLDLAAYDQWLQSALAQLDAALPLCEKYGLRVVVDLHSPPGGKMTSGGYAGSDHGLFADAACQRKFVEVWEHMARRYKQAKMIWGYDLANEPVEGVVEEGLADWQELADRAARAIRAIDPTRTIIVEPPNWGSPDGLKELQPLDVANVVYSVHMYIPGSFTHQGVHGASKPYRYPGEIDGRWWGKAQLEAALKPVVDFQKTYGVHIYLGEFSAIRWAPDHSAYRYLKDLIEIFEAHDWDWSYHAFREWDGWSVEHGPDPKDHTRAQTPTDREELLRSWFAKNAKPREDPSGR
jgi:hypothetical protein